MAKELIEESSDKITHSEESSSHRSTPSEEMFPVLGLPAIHKNIPPKGISYSQAVRKSVERSNNIPIPTAKSPSFTIETPPDSEPDRKQPQPLLIESPIEEEKSEGWDDSSTLLAEDEEESQDEAKRIEIEQHPHGTIFIREKMTIVRSSLKSKYLQIYPFDQNYPNILTLVAKLVYFDEVQEDFDENYLMAYNATTHSLYPVSGEMYQPRQNKQVRAYKINPDNSTGNEIRGQQWSSFEYSYLYQWYNGAWKRLCILNLDPFDRILNRQQDDQPRDHFQPHSNRPRNLRSARRRRALRQSKPKENSRDFFDDTVEWISQMLNIYANYQDLILASSRGDIRDVPADRILDILEEKTEPLTPLFLPSSLNLNVDKPMQRKAADQNNNNTLDVGTYRLFPYTCDCLPIQAVKGFSFEFYAPSCRHRQSFCEETYRLPVNLSFPPPKPTYSQITTLQLPKEKLFPLMDFVIDPFDNYQWILNLPRPYFLSPTKISNLEIRKEKNQEFSSFFVRQPISPQTFFLNILQSILIYLMIKTSPILTAGWPMKNLIVENNIGLVG